MSSRRRTVYTAHEFAALTGVTVRALHHYDRLGLLAPSARSAAGYRLYRAEDVARLQQILTLKFIAMPLKQIKELLDRGTLDLAATLHLQREIVARRRGELDLALRAIDEAERQLAGGALDWQLFRQIVEVISMQKETEWVQSYYTEEQLAELGNRWSPELQEQATRDWSSLIAEIETAAAAGDEPAGDRAQALAGRWSSLIGAFTGGDPGIATGLNRLYSDRANWPEGVKPPYSDDAEAFIQKAVAVRKQRAESG